MRKCTGRGRRWPARHEALGSPANDGVISSDRTCSVVITSDNEFVVSCRHIVRNGIVAPADDFAIGRQPAREPSANTHLYEAAERWARLLSPRPGISPAFDRAVIGYCASLPQTDTDLRKCAWWRAQLVIHLL